MNSWVLGRMLWFASDLKAVHNLVNLVLLGASIFMMVKASHDEAYPLPLFGELAQRSMED
jgi:uncharacterized membrane protein